MSEPAPSPQPESAAEKPELDEGPADEGPADGGPADEGQAGDVEVPLNRAGRRAKARGRAPSHVGPQAGRSDQGKGPRSHTKRQLG